MNNPNQSPMSPSAAPVMQAESLTRHYGVSQGTFKPKLTVKALVDVSFSLASGQTLAVVGESGCGKSTLARTVSLIEAPTGGQLWLDGTEVTHATTRERQALRRTVQLVFQNPYGSLNPRKKISAALEDPLAINTRLSKAERAERARAMLAQVGLRPEYADRYPHMFSGGQRQRIAIARALMLSPQ